LSEEAMELGAFSISLAVRDLGTSRAFYEKLGFEKTGGDDEHYLILANGLTVIGLFQGMFEKNILTFNPGLAQTKEPLHDFTDIRELRDRLVDAGVEMTNDLDPADAGPASIAFLDPDGNPVLIDQFFPKPGTSGD
jgi:lactoylglutathione lyase